MLEVSSAARVLNALAKPTAVTLEHFEDLHSDFDSVLKLRQGGTSEITQLVTTTVLADQEVKHTVDMFKNASNAYLWCKDEMASSLEIFAEISETPATEEGAEQLLDSLIGVMSSVIKVAGQFDRSLRKIFDTSIVKGIQGVLARAEDFEQIRLGGKPKKLVDEAF